MLKSMLFFLSVFFIMFVGCKKDAVNNNSNPEIDTVKVSYNQHIAKILQTSCISCHSTGNTSGYVNLDSYENAKPYGINGNLYGCVQHLDGNVAMPVGAPKLDSAKLLLIKRWCILKCPEN